MKKHFLDFILLGGIITVIVLTFSLLKKEDAITLSDNKVNTEIANLQTAEEFDAEHDLLLKGNDNYVIRISDAEVSSDTKKGQIVAEDKAFNCYLDEKGEILDFTDKHQFAIKISENEWLNIIYNGEKIENLQDSIYKLNAEDVLLGDIKFPLEYISSYTKDALVLEVPVDEEKVKVFITRETLNPEAEYKETLKNLNEIEFKYNPDAKVEEMSSYLIINESEVCRFTTSNPKALDAFRR